MCLPNVITTNDREVGKISSLQQPAGIISFSGNNIRANKAVRCTSGRGHIMPLGLPFQWCETLPPNDTTVCVVVCVSRTDVCVWAMKPQGWGFVGIAES